MITEAKTDPDLAAVWSERVVMAARNQHRSMIERAIARGEIPRDSDVDVLMHMLYGPAYHRLFQRHLPLTEGFVQRVVAVIVAGAKAGGAVPLTTHRD